MQSIVVLLSTRFEAWVRPADLLWLAASSDAVERPWWLIRRERRDVRDVATRVADLATRRVNTSVAWQTIVVIDADELHDAYGPYLAAWMDAATTLTHRPSRITFIVVGQPTVHASIVDDTVRNALPSTRIVTIHAPEFTVHDGMDRKVLAANLLLFLDRHPTSLPRGFTSGTLVHHDPTLAGRNGSQVDLEELRQAAWGMADFVDAYLDEGFHPIEVEAYPLPQPTGVDMPFLQTIESPYPSATKIPWVTFAASEASASRIEVAWRDEVVEPSLRMPEHVTHVAIRAERDTLDALRADVATQPVPTTDKHRRYDARSTVMDRQQLEEMRRDLDDRLGNADVDDAAYRTEGPSRLDWERALLRFFEAASMRPQWFSVVLVNVIAVASMVAIGWSFADGTFTVASVALVLLILNVVAGAGIVVGVRRAAVNLEKLRARANHAALVHWRGRRSTIQKRQAFFVDAANREHVTGALALAGASTLAAEESRAWVQEEFRPAVARLLRALGGQHSRRGRPRVPFEVQVGTPLELQPFAHLHNYREQVAPGEVLLRIDRGADGGGTRVPSDPLSWTLNVLEFVTDLPETPESWRVDTAIEPRRATEAADLASNEPSDAPDDPEAGPGPPARDEQHHEATPEPHVDPLDAGMQERSAEGDPQPDVVPSDGDGHSNRVAWQETDPQSDGADRDRNEDGRVDTNMAGAAHFTQREAEDPTSTSSEEDEADST